ncbi:MAG: hypothetical protein OXF88_12225 [Rhodobacteraceae bacterium]|nr:hypothetical protein [Paracoccaceae bacterium]MCY4137889.1 hypothetical protein [Paracoccaceae bacterium]
MLKRFYGHVAKRIHAMACKYPRIASFGELSDLVESECRPWYLDGPNGVDWIIPNSLLGKREHDLYVDSVLDVTGAAGECYWTAPSPQFRFLSENAESDCVRLVQPLAEAVALSAGGLTETADFWRSLAPAMYTDRGQMRGLIIETLDSLALRYGPVERAPARFVVSHWPFPLWPLTMKEARPDDGDLVSGCEERKRTVEWIDETEAKREPKPEISRAKVEDLSHAYVARESNVEAHANYSGGSKGRGLRTRSSADIARDFELAFHARVKGMLNALSDEVRIALVALGWFAGAQIAV